MTYIQIYSVTSFSAYQPIPTKSHQPKQKFQGHSQHNLGSRAVGPPSMSFQTLCGMRGDSDILVRDRSLCNWGFHMLSQRRRGSQRITQICRDDKRFILFALQTEIANPKYLWTSYMEAPQQEKQWEVCYFLKAARWMRKRQMETYEGALGRQQTVPGRWTTNGGSKALNPWAFGIDPAFCGFVNECIREFRDSKHEINLIRTPNVMSDDNITHHSHPV